MDRTLLIAAGWMLYTTGVHGVVGGARVAGPLAASEVAPFARATLLVVWHGVTWLFLVLVGALAGAAVWPSWRGLVPLMALQVAGMAVVFLVVARRVLGASIRLPQWFLLGPLAVVVAASLGPRSSAVAAGVLLGAMAVVHAGWALGVTWPARDRRELALHVLGDVRLPGRGACVAVAAVLGVFAAAVLTEAAWGRAGRWVVVAVFAARGVGGFWDDRLRPAIRETPYSPYNRFMYSPLCLLIAALTASGSG